MSKRFNVRLLLAFPVYCSFAEAQQRENPPDRLSVSKWHPKNPGP